MRLFVPAIVLLLGVAVAGCASSTQKVPAVPVASRAEVQVDLPRYMGRWYVIANIPYSAEAGKVGAYTEYRLREDGRIDDFYYAHNDSFDQGIELTEAVAWVEDPTSNARWKVRDSWLFTTDHLILYVSDDYRYALAGHPSRDYAWIFAREPDIPEWTYAGLLARLAEQHYDVSRLRRVPQTPEQVGQPGFQ